MTFTEWWMDPKLYQTIYGRSYNQRINNELSMGKI